MKDVTQDEWYDFLVRALLNPLLEISLISTLVKSLVLNRKTKRTTRFRSGIRTPMKRKQKEPGEIDAKLSKQRSEKSPAIAIGSGVKEKLRFNQLPADL